MGSDNEKKYRALLITGLTFWILFIIVRLLGTEAGIPIQGN